MFWNKEKTTQEKINELNILLMTLENHEIKFSIIYNFSDDIVINISDKTSQRKTAKEKKNEKITKDE